MLLPIARIRFDSKYVVRDLNQKVVDDYAKLISDGTDLPEPHVFKHGETYWMADGRHRTEARKQAGFADIEVIIHNGSERDAYIFGISSQDKGLPMTREEKRNAVLAIITDDEWSMKYSDREIAKMCGVYHSFVKNVRTSLSDTSQLSTDSESVDESKVNVAKEEVPYTTPKGKRTTKRNPAARRNQRAAATPTTYDWKNHEKVKAALMREVDVLGKIYNRHNTEDAELLRSDLEAWDKNFREWGNDLKTLKEQSCESA